MSDPRNVDDLPRSEVSDPPTGVSREAPERTAPGRTLVWLFLGLVAVIGFLALLWVLNPASSRLGKSLPDVVPAQPVTPRH
jgi:hypothetical protein